MVRFAELSTKGKNIKDFIKKLGNNLKEALKDQVQDVKISSRLLQGINI